MAFNQVLEIPAHPNIYNGNNQRVYRIEYSIPEVGMNEDTGLIYFAPGFGGDIDSNVYKKMRSEFADKYNLITIQCDYFGSKYMQDCDEYTYSPESIKDKIESEDYQNLLSGEIHPFELLSKYQLNLIVTAKQNEDLNEFADMGYMQAIDIITAVEAVKVILKENQLQFNESNVIGYGHSQGAYLLHLANKLAPHLFTYIIDNSAWVQPVYLSENRYLNKGVGNSVLAIKFDYFAKEYLEDKKALSLHNWYMQFKNGAYIYSLLGTTDNLVDVQDKKGAISKLKYTKFEVVDASKVDGEVFKSTNHGLDADFLKLFDKVYSSLPTHQNKNERKESYIVASSQTQICVDYSGVLPLFYFKDR